ncbi:MAG TPA: cellulase family glycosylhydrolase [Chitinophagaceae bacterium]|nr:cellulase family glycosylhydrolase [Chitinophagaceae bacterium]
MKKISLAFFCFILLQQLQSQTRMNTSLSFLHASGQDMVNETGKKVFLKGVGLGNWMLPEGYMWKFGAGGDRPRKIEKLVSELIGEEKASRFWTLFRKHYITEADIKRIAELGFNSVRPALNSRLFMTEGDNPVYVEEGFQLLDSLISWCRKYNLYVIIDMHGAPGGQTGQNIDDSPNDLPELFMEKKYQDQLEGLWIKLATKYKDEPVVAAYDLLNEPLPVGTGAAAKYKHLLVPLYKRLTAAIRKVDTRHMITLEGFDWSNDWSLFDKPFDENVFYQFHYYCWARPDLLGGIDKFIKKRAELNTPIWVGETGEKGNTIYWSTTQLFEANNIGFSFWPWKKMDTENTPYSIKKPANWDLIAEYSRGGTKPDPAICIRAFDELLENIKLTNCVYYQDVCNAILTRIPGKIEAENYGHTGYMQSYFVRDTTARSAYYRKTEPVKIALDSKDEKQFWSEQSVEVKKSEWLNYTFASEDGNKRKLTIRASAVNGPVLLELRMNKRKLKVMVSDTGFTEIDLGNVPVKQVGNTIRVLVKSGVVKIDWLKLQ